MDVRQVMIALLALVALRVAIGLARRKVMWGWIVAYWVLLTLKNMLDLAACFW